MTKEEENEFWRKQPWITMSDVTRNEEGKFLLSHGAMEKIASEYQLNLEDRIYTLQEARDLILAAEIKRRKSQTEKSTKPDDKTLEQIMLWFQLVPKSKRGDAFFIARGLSKVFSSANVSDVAEAIRMAQEQNLIFNGNTIILEYKNQLHMKAISTTLENWNNKIADQKELANQIGKFLYTNYVIGARYGQLELVLYGSSIAEDTKASIISRFYELLTPIVTKKYQGTKLRGSLLAYNILESYGDLELERIFSILETACPELGISNIRFEVYRINDQNSVIRFLQQASVNKLSAIEIALQLQFLQSKYPKEYLLRTVKDMEQSGLELPYQEIYQKLGIQNKGENTKSSENAEQKSETTSEPSSNTLANKKTKRHKIAKHEKAKNPSDKKKVFTGLITASAVMTTTFLTVLLGISPITAAKNCVASISALTLGNATMSQTLSMSSEFIALLVSASTSIVGTISLLKNTKRKRRLRKQMELVEAMDKVNEEKSSEQVDEENEKGGRIR